MTTATLPATSCRAALLAELRQRVADDEERIRTADDAAADAVRRYQPAREAAERLAATVRETAAAADAARFESARVAATLRDRVRSAASQTERDAVEMLDRDVRRAIEDLQTVNYERASDAKKQAAHSRVKILTEARHAIGDTLLADDVPAAIAALRARLAID